MKTIKILSIYILMLFNINAFAVCNANNVAPLYTRLDLVCYQCMMPIKMGGVALSSGFMPEGFARVNNPICKCPGKIFGYPQVGTPVGYYAPDRLIDIVQDSMCFPSIASDLSKNNIELNLKLGGTKTKEDNQSGITFYQAHEIYFAASAILELFTDVLCLTSNSSILDIGYITEFDPVWQKSSLSAILSPEAILFNNPVTNLACVPDSISSQANLPLDPLFWCKGSWGNTYPLSGYVSKKALVEDAASVAATFIFKMHRELLTWNSSGPSALCFAHPLPIWIKSSNRLQLMHPIPNPFASSIGQSAMIWGIAKNPPFVGDSFGFLWFRKHDCCFL